MWAKNLPTYVKAHISDEAFTADTHKAVMEKADKCWLTHRSETPAVAAIKAENAAALAESTDFENPAVAAIRGRGRGYRGGRGGFRGNRGFNPNNRGGRGAANTPSSTNPTTNPSTPATRGARKPRGPKHSTAQEGSCYIHHQFGVEAWSCADRHNCPMRDIESPRPRHNRNIPIEK